MTSPHRYLLLAPPSTIAKKIHLQYSQMNWTKYSIIKRWTCAMCEPKTYAQFSVRHSAVDVCGTSPLGTICFTTLFSLRLPLIGISLFLSAYKQLTEMERQNANKNTEQRKSFYLTSSLFVFLVCNAISFCVSLHWREDGRLMHALFIIM